MVGLVACLVSFGFATIFAQVPTPPPASPSLGPQAVVLFATVTGEENSGSIKETSDKRFKDLRARTSFGPSVCRSHCRLQ